MVTWMLVVVFAHGSLTHEIMLKDEATCREKLAYHFSTYKVCNKNQRCTDGVVASCRVIEDSDWPKSVPMSKEENARYR